MPIELTPNNIRVMRWPTHRNAYDRFVSRGSQVPKLVDEQNSSRPDQQWGAPSLKCRKARRGISERAITDSV